MISKILTALFVCSGTCYGQFFGYPTRDSQQANNSASFYESGGIFSSPSDELLRQKLAQLQPPVISTTHGKVRGIKTDVDNIQLKPVIQYLGIPYAMPPTGRLRWQRPVAARQWKGVYNATYHRNVCPQSLSGPLPKVLLPVWHRTNSTFMREKTAKMSEDCLFLNIYVPATFYVKETSHPKFYKNRLPVMIHFHGYTYSEGSGNFYDGSVLSSYGDVIVITFNYRIGVLGFLSTGDNNAPGNYGLWDQVALVKWMSENIGFFGGDPERVTAFGSGSGASSISLLMLSVHTEGNFHGNISGAYFRQAILQSGTALAPWAVVKEPRKHSRALSRSPLIGCLGKTTLSIVTCLRSKPWRTLISVAVKPEPYNLAFGPVVDGCAKDRLLCDTPSKLMENGEYLNYQIIMGVSQGAGFGYVQDRFKMNAQQSKQNPSPFYSSDIIYRKKDFDIDVAKFIDSFYGNADIASNLIEEVVQFLYTDWIDENDPSRLKKSLTDMYSDRQWVEPAVRALDIHTKLKYHAYFYTFNHHPGSDVDRSWIESAHGEQEPFVFGAPFLSNGYPLFPYNFTKNDKLISTAVMTYWTNFAKNNDPMVGRPQQTQFITGKPNSFEGVIWPRYNTAERQNLRISTQPSIENHYRAKKVALWRTFLPKLAGADDSIWTARRLNPIMPPPGSYPTPPPGAITTKWTPLPRSLDSDEDKQKDSQPAADNSAMSLQLSITLAVGFVLLFVNIIAFAVVSYHKEKDKYQIEKLKSEVRSYRKSRNGSDKRPPTDGQNTTETYFENGQASKHILNETPPNGALHGVSANPCVAKQRPHSAVYGTSHQLHQDTDHKRANTSLSVLYHEVTKNLNYSPVQETPMTTSHLQAPHHANNTPTCSDNEHSDPNRWSKSDNGDEIPGSSATKNADRKPYIAPLQDRSAEPKHANYATLNRNGARCQSSLAVYNRQDLTPPEFNQREEVPAYRSLSRGPPLNPNTLFANESAMGYNTISSTNKAGDSNKAAFEKNKASSFRPSHYAKVDGICASACHGVLMPLLPKQSIGTMSSVTTKL